MAEAAFMLWWFCTGFNGSVHEAVKAYESETRPREEWLTVDGYVHWIDWRLRQLEKQVYG